MNADERRYDAFFLAEGRFVVRGHYFMIAGDVIEGSLHVGDLIVHTEPKVSINDREILEVETGSRHQKEDLLASVLRQKHIQKSSNSNGFHLKVSRL